MAYETFLALYRLALSLHDTISDEQEGEDAFGEQAKSKAVVAEEWLRTIWMLSGTPLQGKRWYAGYRNRSAFCRVIGIPATTYYKWECGISQYPSYIDELLTYIFLAKIMAKR